MPLSFNTSNGAAYIPVGPSNQDSVVAPNINPGVAYYFPTNGILKSWYVAYANLTPSYSPGTNALGGIAYYYMYHNQDGSIPASHAYISNIAIASAGGANVGPIALNYSVSKGDFICITYRSGEVSGEFPAYSSVQIHVLFQET